MEVQQMDMIIGAYTPEWGHTALAEGFGKLYALRSLPGGSSLCVMEIPEPTAGIVTPDDLVLKSETRTPGEHSCHVTILKNQAVVSDYTSGTLSLFDLDGEGVPVGEPQLIRFDGSGPNPERQAAPHIHSSWTAPDGKSLVVADLGCDRIYRYSVKDGCLDAGSQEAFALPAGCGPRHCAFSDDGTMLYVATELSDEVLTYSYPEMELMARMLVNDALPGGGSHIALTPDGKFLYVSSRLKNDGIAIFRVLENGLLEKTGYQVTGAHPRHFAISEDGKELVGAARDGNSLEVFDIDGSTGNLIKKQEYKADRPVFVILKK